MANKALFGSSRGRTVKATDTPNAAGGVAYALSPEQALARYAMTGCLSNTFYVKAEDHLERVLKLAKACDPLFIAKLAVLARKSGHMKDMPALLLAHLATRGDEGRRPLRAAFPLAIDNGRMVRNFVQIMRSGQLGRKSLGTGPRNLVRGFFDRNAPNWLYRQLAVGQDPSGGDIVKMVHPKGRTPEHEALFGYMIGKAPKDRRLKAWKNLPPLVKEYEAWKEDRTQPPPAVPFQLLTSDTLTPEQWAVIFRHGGWHFVRQNINTALRRGAFKSDPSLVEFVVDKLRDADIIAKARVMPYQLLATYRYLDSGVPREIVDALHDALELAMGNAPVMEGKTLIIVDISGSMGWPITGYGGNKKASKVMCVDVAGLIASAILRKNRDATVLAVNTRAYLAHLEPRDTVLTNAKRISDTLSGGTALSEGLRHANATHMKVDHVFIVSDQESWADAHSSKGTALMNEWERLRSRNRGAKLVAIDIVPGQTHQLDGDHPEILMTSGWSDAVFQTIDAFLRGDAASWVEMVNAVDLSTH